MIRLDMKNYNIITEKKQNCPHNRQVKLINILQVMKYDNLKLLIMESSPSKMGEEFYWALWNLKACVCYF